MLGSKLNKFYKHHNGSLRYFECFTAPKCIYYKMSSWFIVIYDTYVLVFLSVYYVSFLFIFQAALSIYFQEVPVAHPTHSAVSLVEYLSTTFFTTLFYRYGFSMFTSRDYESHVDFVKFLRQTLSRDI